VTLVLWLLFLVPFLLGLAVQSLLRSVFRRYRAVPNRLGVTGAEAARALLDAHGLRRVHVELVPGTLSDHYDSAAQALRLSPVVARERSVAALGIAAHEVSHAFQDAEGSRTYRWRQRVGEPIAHFAPFSGLVLIGGFWFGNLLLIMLGLAYAAALVLFALATLPVELGASHRARRLLERTRLTDASEARGVRRVLAAAALTYVVGLLDRLGMFLVLVVVAEGLHSAAT
jgi:Zn-dependent membrane protease YugP